MQFLIKYSNHPLHCNKPAVTNPPKTGTMVELHSLQDLLRIGVTMYTALVVRATIEDYDIPFQLQDYDDEGNPPEYYSQTEREEDHVVDKLPEGWREMLWLEVYNGYRE